MLSMSPTGLSFPAGLDGGYAHSVEVSEHLLATKQQTSCVLLLGNGLASHWAVVMIFENGEVFSVELLARDMQTGERWGKSNFHMRQLRLEDPWENLSEASSHEDVQVPVPGLPRAGLRVNLNEASSHQDVQDEGSEDSEDSEACLECTPLVNGSDNFNETNLNREDAEAADPVGHAGPPKESDLRQKFRNKQFLHRRRTSRTALIEGYTRHFGYNMLCEIMWVHKTSPAELFLRAEAVPLN